MSFDTIQSLEDSIKLFLRQQLAARNVSIAPFTKGANRYSSFEGSSCGLSVKKSFCRLFTASTMAVVGYSRTVTMGMNVCIFWQLSGQGGGNTITDRGYTGHKQNDDLGLIYMNARYYAPYINRFISADTIVPDPTNPQNFNRYSYGYNNPVKYSDPTGHLAENEIEDYFGYNSRQDMLDAGWGGQLVDWLWDPDVTWGDVFTYNDTSEAMLTLFEAIEQDSGLYRGGFWGLNGEKRGDEVSPYEINSLNDHTQSAVSLEEAYFNNWENLPRQTGSDGYNNYDPTTYIDMFTAGTVSASFSIGGVFFLGEPVSWVAGGITVIGGSVAIYQAATETLTHNYPVLRLPSLYGNSPFTLHAFLPQGLYE